MSRFIFTILVLTGFSFNLYSQAASSASIGATLIEPTTQTKTVGVNFTVGAVIFAGTVTMVPGGIRPGTPNIMLPSEGTFTAAAFVAEGTVGYAYTITVPSSPLEIKTGNKTLVVDSFTRDPMLNPETGLYAGVYVSVTPFDVTVNYN